MNHPDPVRLPSGEDFVPLQQSKHPAGQRRRVIVEITYEGEIDWVNQTLAKSLHTPFVTPFGTITKITQHDWLLMPEDTNDARP